jgi:predicted dehydrogenase
MGRIYSNHIARHVDRAKLVAVASRTPEVAANVARQVDGLNVYDDYRDLLADPKLDGVIVATHTYAHHDIVIAAAEAGKAIFCEKPIALTLAETDAMLAAGEKAGVLFQVGFMRRFDKGYSAAKRQIEAGAIGTPIVAHSISRDPNCPEAKWADPTLSGGMILDLAIHDFDILRWLMNDEVERIYAEGGLLTCPELAQVGDIDNAAMCLRFSRGGLGNVEACRNAQYGYDIRCEIRGTEGTLQVGYLRETPLLTLTRQGVCHDIVPWFQERFSSAYGAQIDHFIRCIQRDEPPIAGPADARAALQISLAAIRSQQEGRPIKVADV